MSTCRGAVMAFHNRIGYAFRQFKREHRQLAAEVLSASKELRQKVSHVIAENPPARIDTSWPRWKGKKTNNETTILESPHVGSTTRRKLEVHNSDSTTAPEDSCSVTEAWSDSSSLHGSLCSRRHSRKPRRGRRAKARAHSKLFEDTKSQGFQLESPALGESRWTGTLGTLSECMEEDIYGDCSDIFEGIAHPGVDRGLQLDAKIDADDPKKANPDGTHFEVRLCKSDMVSMGLSIHETAEGDALHISSVLADGLVDSWNAKCSEDSRIHDGDRIVRINACSNFQDMMGEIMKTGDNVLEVIRGPFPTPQVVAAGCPQASPRSMEQVAFPVNPTPPYKRPCIEHAFDDDMSKGDLQTLLARRLAESRSSR